MGHTQNKQIQRSKKWIFEALLTLLEQYEYESITIRQITEEATIARQTFYRHYRNKDDIIVDYLISIFREHGDSIGNDNLSPYVQMLNAIYSHKDTLIRLSDAGVSYMLMTLVSPLCTMIDEYLLQQQVIIAPNSFEYQLMRFEVGGLLSIVKNWVDNGFSSSPMAVGATLEAILQPYKQYSMYLPDFFPQFSAKN